MIHVIINGILGRMGKEIAHIVLNDQEMQLIGCTEKEGHSSLGMDIGELLGYGKMNTAITSSVQQIPLDLTNNAVIIDFTTPNSTRKLVQELQTNNIKAKLVIGTTGLADLDIQTIHSLSQISAVLYSPNMSLGINYLFYLTQITAEKLGEDFDIEIIETHHRFKKDSPSGTAQRLGEIAAKTIHSSYSKAVTHGRKGLSNGRRKREIGIHAVRGGDIVGDHTVLFAGLGERLELRHSAQNRTTFAQGAVKAAKWLSSQSSGFYSMRDLLGF